MALQVLCLVKNTYWYNNPFITELQTSNFYCTVLYMFLFHNLFPRLSKYRSYSNLFLFTAQHCARFLVMLFVYLCLLQTKEVYPWATKAPNFILLRP